jgi:hypothetical protein
VVIAIVYALLPKKQLKMLIYRHKLRFCIEFCPGHILALVCAHNVFQRPVSTFKPNLSKPDKQKQKDSFFDLSQGTNITLWY